MERSRSRYPKIRWGWLYGVVTPLVGLLGLVDVAVPQGAARRALEVTVTLCLFGFMALWVRANRVGLVLRGQRGRVAAPRRVIAVLHDEEPAKNRFRNPYTSPAVEEYLAVVGRRRRA
jgi:hypothetical protein